MAYQFIKNSSKTFGVNWLLRRFNIYPNVLYYNYLKTEKLAIDYKKHEFAEKSVESITKTTVFWVTAACVYF